jgi:hypothetical protein
MAKVMEYFDNDWKGNTKCYESHKALPVGEHQIWGGSASWPVVKDADIYISLQDGSTCGRISDPWDDHHVIEIQHFIQDGGVPKDSIRFVKMVKWICNQLQKGKKIHAGCIGGHGRTGLLLAAVVREATGEKDAIQYVRKHYCKKSVESHKQVQFLMQHFGVSEVEGFKDWGGGGKSTLYIPSHESPSGKGKYNSGNHSLYTTPDKTPKSAPGMLPTYHPSIFNAGFIGSPESGSALTLTPIKSKRNLWKK